MFIGWRGAIGGIWAGGVAIDPHIILVGAGGIGMSVVLIGSGVGVGGVCAGTVWR